MKSKDVRPTGQYYVFDTETNRRVCALDEAPATLWDGLLERMTGEDGYVASQKELDTLVHYPGLARKYEVRQRYIDERGDTVEYHSEIGGGGHIENSRWAGYVGRHATIEDMLVYARRVQFGRIEADNRERAARQAQDHAERYTKALAELDSFEARDKLRERIAGIEDRRRRSEWMARYPELFDKTAAYEMAEADREAEREEQRELWHTAGGEPIYLGPGITIPDEQP